jgi:predicted Zn-dependent protease with MMP-like domain
MSRRMASGQTFAPTLEQIEALARTAVARLPDTFRRFLDGVRLEVQDFPDDEVVREMGLESPFDILGLYQGHSIAKPVELSGNLPDTVFLYRRPILDEWADGGDSLEALVAHVLVHEVGHHFGLSDDDMDRIEAQAD